MDEIQESGEVIDRKSGADMRKYQTSPHNFISRFDEKVYTPDSKLVQQLHQYLDLVALTNEPLAFAIDQTVAELMRVEGYGSPLRNIGLQDPELLENKS